MTACIDRALALARRGFYVFPLIPGSKQPAVNDWPNVATRDEKQIRALFNDDANIGIFTGKFNLGDGDAPLAVIDLDTKNGKDGMRELERIAKECGEKLPNTLTVTTPTGGRHLYFIVGRDIGSKADTLAPGIDTRGAGGYVVAPGSVVEGKQYQFTTNLGAAIAPCPGWLAEKLPRPGRKKSDSQPAPTNINADRAAARAVHYLRNESPLAIEGRGGDQTTFQVAASIKDFGVSEAVALDLMAKHWNPRCIPPWSADDLARKVHNAYEYGAEPVGAAAPEADFTPVAESAAPEAESAAPETIFDTPIGPPLICTRVSDVASKPIRWLWENTFAFGKLSLIAGDPGLGKSQLSLSLAATVSTGGTLPNRQRCDAGDVLLITGEDDIADTIRPRLEAAGADVNRILVVEGVPIQGAARPINLATDAARIAQYVRDLPDLRLVIIDPITAFLGDTDSHKTAEVRALLRDLARFASDTGAAVLAITHLNKSSGTAAIGRITGSIGFVAAARAAYVVTRDKADESLRVMAPVKNNIGDDRTAYFFKVESVTLDSGIRTSRVDWQAETEFLSAEEALEQKPKEATAPAQAAAETFLLQMLAAGPRAAKEVQEMADTAGFSWATVRRVKARLGVVSLKEPGTKHGGYVWRLPNFNPSASADAIFD